MQAGHFNTIPYRRFLFFVGFAIAALLNSNPPAFAIEESNVLVLYNADSGDSGDGFQIAEYYRQARPGVHVLGLSGIDSILTGATRETVSANNYLNVIRPQVLSAIASLPDSIDVIVTTKGLPLLIDAGIKGTDSDTMLWRRYSSLESELTRIDSIASRNAMGDQFIFTGFPDLDPRLASNPYYNSNAPFSRAGSDPVNGDIRLTARLDGFDLRAVKDSIDRAQTTFVVPRATYLIADDAPSAGTDQMIDNVPGGPGPGMVNAVQSAGYRISYNNSSEAITTAPGPVIGYVSHGVNDQDGGLEPDYIENQLGFHLSNGAVFLSHESRNARSFSTLAVEGQGLIAQWLAIGGTAGLGHVHEPYNGADNVTNEDLFFASMLPRANSQPGESGLTFVESAWNATRQLSYVNTVVGDPLMKWQTWLPGDTNLDGKVEYKDFYAMQGNWLKAGDFADGDFNFDGFIDTKDFLILQSNWLGDAGSNLAKLSTNDFSVVPVLHGVFSPPRLWARLLSEANFDGDLDVDDDDLAIIQAAYGENALGDVDGDGDTDGRDFLAWQREYLHYDFTADFEIDAIVGSGDLGVWRTSYGTNRGGDADGDGDTDGRDFLIWQRETNEVSPPIEIANTQSLAVVPEPGYLAPALALLILTLALARVDLIPFRSSFAR